MKQYHVKISRTALGDMEEIYNYIAIHLQEPETAMRQYDRIAEAIQSLDILPERCPLLDCEPEHSQGLRRLLVDHYSVFYVVGADTVSVARVLYSGADIVYRLRNMKGKKVYLMNAVIYARYSSDNQREESIDGQIRECMEYCSRNGMTVIKEYIDRALSAKTDQRPDFQRMIKDSVKGLFDVVVVWKLDRFARNRYDSAHYKAVLKKNSVRVISAKENIADGPEGIILESMLEGMAEYYSAELSVKVIRGHTENALK